MGPITNRYLDLAQKIRLLDCPFKHLLNVKIVLKKSELFLGISHEIAK